METKKRKITSMLILCSLVTLSVISPKELPAMDLDQFKWKNRLLFLFSPDRTHPLFKQLHRAISESKSGVEDRDLVIFEIHESDTSRIDQKHIDSQTALSLREQYRVPSSNFTVILVGKDGGVKLRRQDDTQLVDIFGLIDSMPMRQQEMRQKKN